MRSELLIEVVGSPAPQLCVERVSRRRGGEEERRRGGEEERRRGGEEERRRGGEEERTRSARGRADEDAPLP